MEAWRTLLLLLAGGTHKVRRTVQGSGFFDRPRVEVASDYAGGGGGSVAGLLEKARRLCRGFVRSVASDRVCDHFMTRPCVSSGETSVNTCNVIKAFALRNLLRSTNPRPRSLSRRRRGRLFRRSRPHRIPWLTSCGRFQRLSFVHPSLPPVGSPPAHPES